MTDGQAMDRAEFIGPFSRAGSPKKETAKRKLQQHKLINHVD